MGTRDLIPVAEYLRMSTDDQPNSIPCQKEEIRRYAAKHGFEIVATYSDPGRSGVEIVHRPGLRQLLHDVMTRQTAFKKILAYDVSRWGRFPDEDESAHYEFICRSAGVPVHYCAEEFENNGTMSSAIMKALKRTMAAQFSRELSVKVSAAQRRIAAEGFRVGGTPGFGLRRLVISEDGHRRLLRNNEVKGMKSDRVTLVPGPKSEVDTVKRIFVLAADLKNTPLRIAQELNRRNVPFTSGRKWREQTVLRILQNEKYAGTHVYGKLETRFYMRQTTRRPDQWITKADAFPAIVTREQFAKAQANIRKRGKWPSKPDDIVLEHMRKVLVSEGKLTEGLLRKYKAYGYRRYTRRYGSVTRAYQLVGYQPTQSTLKGVNSSQKIRRLRADVLRQLKDLFPSQLRFVRMPGQIQRQVIEVENERRFALHVCRPTTGTRSGEARWVLLSQPKENGLPALICTTDSHFDRILDYFVVPPCPESRKYCFTISKDHPLLAGGKRLDVLPQFHAVAKQFPANWTSQEDAITVEDVLLSPSDSTIRIAGEDFQLSKPQWAILKMLIQNAGRVVPAELLAQEGLTSLLPRTARTRDLIGSFLRTQLIRLRRKLGRYRARIVCVTGQGYVYAATPFNQDENYQLKFVASAKSAVSKLQAP